MICHLKSDVMKIKAVIVDDELIAREVLRSYLTKYCPQVEILGEAENIKEAVPLIAESNLSWSFWM